MTYIPFTAYIYLTDMIFLIGRITVSTYPRRQTTVSADNGNGLPFQRITAAGYRFSG